jgi:hypothetical protein
MMTGPVEDAVSLRRSVRTLRAQRVELAQMAAEARRHVRSVGDVTMRVPGADTALQDLLEEYARGCLVMTRGLEGLVRELQALMAGHQTQPPGASRGPGHSG